jgi:starch-binding outer membrane protein, SusD/RagB family
MRYYTRLIRTALAAGALILVACSDWLSVNTPNVIDDALIDPVRDAGILARSAEQNFAAAYGHLIVYSSWFVGETDVSETFPTRNEFGRRSVVIQNGSLDTDVWFPLSQTVALASKVMEAPLADTTANLNYTRAGLYLAWSYLFMAEQFCEGTTRGGPPLTTAAMLDSARQHFTLAIARGLAAAGEGTTLANSGRVGLARTELQAGNLAAAIAAASAVPANFVHNIDFMDDLSSRFRVANRMFFYVRDRGSIAVAPIWRVGPQLPAAQVQDTEPRLPWRVTAATGDFAPQDAFYSSDRGVPYAIQMKYPAYNTPVRLASKLEADYIGAEASGTAEQLALIDARRLANAQPVFSDTVKRNNPDSVLTEFFTQKGFEFYLEGKRLGDFRRHPANIIGVPVPGATYWKPGFAPVGNQICYPLPITETDNNPNFP